MKSLHEVFQRVIPYGVALAVVVVLRSTGLAQTLDLVLYDLITSRRPALSGQDTPITLIGIEESDIQRFGWPIDDSLFCRAIDQLNGGGVDVIGFDIYRDQGVGPEQQCLRDRFRDEQNLVSIFNVAAAIGPVPETPVERQSYNDLSLDPDGVLRRDLVHVTGQDEATVSFPMRIVEIAIESRRLRDAIDARTHQDAWLSPSGGGYHNERDAGMGLQRLLRYREPNSYRMYSLTQLLSGDVPDEMIRDRIVLIGSTAPSLRDLFQVPHTRFRHGDELFQLTGVEIHANRVATLLDQQDDSFQAGWIMPNAGNKTLIFFCMGVGLLLGEAIPKLRRSVLVVLSLAALLAGGLTTLLWHNIWIGTAMPLTGLLSMGGVAWMRRGAASQKHSEQIKQLLGQTTSPAIAQQLWEQRDELLSNGRFAGRQLPITVLFTDTANFTTVSEGLSPQELMDWLNRGMDVCVPAVTKRDGVVNKFTGDGMLAVFGVPVGQNPEADAQAAIEAVLDINKGLEQLNQELLKAGKPMMRIRIGIHSGDALVGSMGSAERCEYAVIGDSVNCASRLESLNKQRHSGLLRVLMSSNTLELLDPSFRSQLSLEQWGPIQVKGREQPLEVSELKMDSAPATDSATLE